MGPGSKHFSAASILVVSAAMVCVLAVTAASPALAATSSVSATSNFRFSPATVTVHVGDTVVWSNPTGTAHTVTANSGTFNSGNLNPGQSFSHTFTTPGTYAYHCTYHVSLGMVGTIVVLGGSGGGSSTTALPNTGAGPRLGLFAGIGVLLVSAGAALIISSRRRRA